MALSRAANRSRFVMCGSISGYNTGTHQTKGVRNLTQITIHRVRMEGFIVLDYEDEIPEAQQQLCQWLLEGKIKRLETIVKGGLKVCEYAINDLFTGKNTGKLLVEVKPCEE